MNTKTSNRPSLIGYIEEGLKIRLAADEEREKGHLQLADEMYSQALRIRSILGVHEDIESAVTLFRLAEVCVLLGQTYRAERLRMHANHVVEARSNYSSEPSEVDYGSMVEEIQLQRWAGEVQVA